MRRLAVCGPHTGQVTSALAHRAEERRSRALHDALDRAAVAPLASLAFAVVDREVMLEQAELTIGAAMIAQRGAAGADRIVEHVADAFHQRDGAGVGLARAGRDGRSTPLGRQPRPPQGLADIDVAEPRDDSLIGERGLEACLLAAAGLRQCGGIEAVAERLWAERPQ